MAEKTADLVAARLANTEPCTTTTVALPDGEACRWTAPGVAPKYWYHANNPDDMILCECEMVPQSAIGNRQSAINEIIKCAPGAEEEMTLEAITLRSRAGKVPARAHSAASARICVLLSGILVGENNFIDMQPNRSANCCCGGGGFLQAGMTGHRRSYGKRKFDQIAATGAACVLTPVITAIPRWKISAIFTAANTASSISGR